MLTVALSFDEHLARYFELLPATSAIVPTAGALTFPTTVDVTRARDKVDYASLVCANVLLRSSHYVGHHSPGVFCI